VKKQYKSKEPKFEHMCEGCQTVYKSADIKGRFCVECKTPRKCLCGCGRIVKTPGKFYFSGCRVRGKTYQEIYGEAIPKCGFQKDEGNLMKNILFLDKALNNVTKNRTLYDGINFRSKWEVEVYKDLKKQNISPLYEPSIKYPSGWLKPDFLLGNTIIEVSGFASAFSDTRQRNIKKLHKYLEFTDKNIIFIVSKKHIQFYLEVFNEQKRIKFYEYEQKNTIHYPKG